MDVSGDDTSGDAVIARSFAQYDLGSLVGTIHDSSGAVVPNVTVTVTNDSTAIAKIVKTDQSGGYDVPSLRVGVYTISASASGFAIAEAKQSPSPWARVSASIWS